MGFSSCVLIPGGSNNQLKPTKIENQRQCIKDGGKVIKLLFFYQITLIQFFFLSSVIITMTVVFNFVKIKDFLTSLVYANILKYIIIQILYRQNHYSNKKSEFLILHTGFGNKFGL